VNWLEEEEPEGTEEQRAGNGSSSPVDARLCRSLGFLSRGCLGQRASWLCSMMRQLHTLSLSLSL
jgi:hypothetical protein